MSDSEIVPIVPAVSAIPAFPDFPEALQVPNVPETPRVSRPPVIVGNWKMYKTIEESVQFVKDLIPQIKNSAPSVYLAVPFTAIKAVSDEAKDSNLVIGAQNMNDASEGAFTGEIAGKMLAEAGAKFVILGHSERRTLFNETNDFVNRKVKRALSDGLQPILCVGETKEQNEEGETQEVLKLQLVESLNDLTPEQMEKIIVAYEPIWAIGTGKTATPENAQQAHVFCRESIREIWGEDLASRLIILYGGSVKPDNVKLLMEQDDIDGVLVGGASLSLESFVKIIDYGIL